MALISVAEAAKRLDVTPVRVRQRIADGSLHAVRIGHRWAIDEALLHQLSARPPGQPLSQRAAWALLALSADAPAASDLVARPKQPARDSELVQRLFLAPSEWSRARRRLAVLLAAPLPDDLLRAWLRRRAERRVYRAAERDLADVRADRRMLPSGVSHPNSGVAAAGMAEGYLARDDLAAFVDDYLLVEAPDGRGNVVLHVASERPPSVWPLLLAADLADYHRPRESGQARQLVAGLR